MESTNNLLLYFWLTRSLLTSSIGHNKSPAKSATRGGAAEKYDWLNEEATDRVKGAFGQEMSGRRLKSEYLCRVRVTGGDGDG